jgi:hypothetical protein
MVNLAGDKNCDKTIREELQIANIPIIELGAATNREVPSSVIGVLNGFKFVRGWRYWMVYGDMPLDDAKYIYDMYKDLNIRVAGHCMNPPPEEWCEPKEWMEKCKPIVDRCLIKKEISMDECNRLCKEIRKQDDQFIFTYHIDTQLGLCKLAETIKQRNITTELK